MKTSLMINRILISNFATINNINIEFTKGLNIITGETGAGKSLIFDSISTVLSKKIDRRTIRPEKGETTIEIRLQKKNESLLLKKEISKNGSSKNQINTKDAKASELHKIGLSEILLFGQLNAQDLLQSNKYFRYLDSFSCSTDIQNILSDNIEIFLKLSKKLKKSEKEKEIYNEKIKLSVYELNEISTVKLDKEEWEKLNGKIKKIENYENIKLLTNECENIIENNNDNLLSSNISSLIDLDKEFDILSPLVEQLLIAKDEISTNLRKLSDFDFDQDYLTELREQRDNILSLIKKFGSSFDNMMEYKLSLEDLVSKKNYYSKKIKDLNESIEKLTVEIKKNSTKLSELRSFNLGNLENNIKTVLRSLGFKGVNFKIELRNKLKGDIEINNRFIDSTGAEDVLFLFSSTKDLKMNILSKVASGGELSRLALALQSTILKEKLLPCIVFDEIDVGISGKVAQAMGEYIYKLSRNHQVIIITHLPQIASFADHFVEIKKIEDNNITSTKAFYANTREKKINAIASLASGKKITKETENYAISLIVESEKKKKRNLDFFQYNKTIISFIDFYW